MWYTISRIASTKKIIWGVLLLSSLFISAVVCVYKGSYSPYDFAYWGLQKDSIILQDRWMIGNSPQWEMKLCDIYIKDGCLWEWILRGAHVQRTWENNHGVVRIYIHIDNKNIQKNPFTEWHMYQLFWPHDHRNIHSMEHIPKFGIIAGHTVYLLSEREVVNLSEETQAIFRDIETNPRVIIDEKRVDQ